MTAQVLVEDQDVSDIISALKVKHKQCGRMYDKIAHYFAGDDLLQICRSLWEFCKDNLQYVEETVDEQYVSSPFTILKRGTSDCKGYALFIAGVLDALKRQGYDLKWCFRFVPSRLLSTEIGHVFVVVNPDTDNIWIDPVLSRFDAHYPNFVKRDEYVKTNKVGRVTMGAIGRMDRIGLVALPSSRIGAAVPMTAAQMGIPYFQKIFNRGFAAKHPGTLNEIAVNPPITYWLNGKPFPLPPENTVAGSAVPELPLGLEVRYQPTWMGLKINPTYKNTPMLRPIVVADPAGGPNKLRLSTGDPKAPYDLSENTGTTLSADDSFLLSILESALGALINSYSSNPYANNPAQSHGLDWKIFNKRDKDDFNVFADPDSGTFFSNTVLPVVLAVEGAAANLIVPGSGNAVKSFTSAELGQAGVHTGGTAAGENNVIRTDDSTTVVSSGSVVSGPIPIILLGIGAYLLFNKSDSHGKK